MRARWLEWVVVCLVLLAPGSIPVEKAGAQRQDGGGILIPPVVVGPGGLPALEPLYSGCGGVNAPAVNAGYEQRVVELVNDERTSRGLPPYKRVNDLDRAARYHSTDMGQDNYFKHDTYDGNGGTNFVCNTWQRIQTYYPSPSAENIAAGYSTPAEVMIGWMNSDGHRANILSQYSWEIGVGYYSGSGQWGTYWTQDFGRRNGIYPLVINDEDQQTDTRQVTIFIYGNWQEMRLQNDGGTWGAWQPFQSRFGWTLGNGVGDHTVTAELRKTGESTTSSDNIYSTAYTPPVLGNMPGQLAFFYSISTGKLTPPSIQITPADISEGAALTWQLTRQGNWFSLAPMSGSTPASFTITPDNFDTHSEAVYTGSVVVTVSDPQGVTGSPFTIHLTLRVTNAVSKVFIPFIGNSDS